MSLSYDSQDRLSLLEIATGDGGVYQSLAFTHTDFGFVRSDGVQESVVVLDDSGRFVSSTTSDNTGQSFEVIWTYGDEGEPSILRRIMSDGTTSEGTMTYFVPEPMTNSTLLVTIGDAPAYEAHYQRYRVTSNSCPSRAKPPSVSMIEFNALPEDLMVYLQM